MWGYLGLTTAYILIISMLLWLFITSRTALVLKIIIIPIAMWYGLVLYYTPENLMGWPVNISSASLLPGDAFVISTSIKEPSKKTSDPGAIFITVIETNKNSEVVFSLSPKDAFVYRGNGEPRTYKIPYSKELHEKIIKAQREQAREKGSQIKTKSKGLRKDGTRGDDKSDADEMFRIFNPLRLIPKDHE